MNGMVSRLRDTTAYLDDIILIDRTKKKIEEQIECLLKCIADYGFHLRSGKYKFFLKSIEYLGLIFNSWSWMNSSHIFRSPTPAEKKNGKIWEEALTIIYAMKKFHKFVYCRHFTLLIHNIPFLSIFGSKMAFQHIWRVVVRVGQ